MEISKMTCSYKSTLKDAMTIIDGNGKRVVFCINEKEELIGFLQMGI